MRHRALHPRKHAPRLGRKLPIFALMAPRRRWPRWREPLGYYRLRLVGVDALVAFRIHSGHNVVIRCSTLHSSVVVLRGSR